MLSGMFALATFSCYAGVRPVNDSDFRQEARELALTVQQRMDLDFWDAERRLYREAWSPREQLGQPAFNWGVGVLLSGLNGLAPHDAGALARLREYLPAVERYWNPRPPVAGFDVLPDPGGVDRYYDDNAWMVLALLETAQVTGEEKWVDWAEKSLLYVLSGEDEKLGGGIYWRESDKASKNTCSNSPSAVAALAVYRVTGKREYRDAAERLMRWTIKHLMDPADKLMWDHIDLAGNIEKTKWSYNTALTVRALAELEDLAESEGGIASFPVTAKEMWDAGWPRWFLGERGMLGPGRFAHLLLEVGLERGWVSEADQATLVRALWRLGEARGWRYGHDWDRPADEDATRFEVLDQASVVRAMALIGWPSAEHCN